MDKKDAVIGYLTKVFDETLKADLQQMMSVPQGLDFGIIILVCSGIELIGALDQGHMRRPTRRFCEVLERYFPSEYRKYGAILYNLFRCGLAHQAFIKPGTATARNPDYEHCHLKGVIVDEETLLYMHPDVFAQDFFQAIEKFRSSLENDPQKVDAAYCAIEAIYRESPSWTDQQLEVCLSLPPLPPGVPGYTRQPLPTRLKSSEVSKF